METEGVCGKEVIFVSVYISLCPCFLGGRKEFSLGI